MIGLVVLCLRSIGISVSDLDRTIGTGRHAVNSWDEGPVPGKDASSWGIVNGDYRFLFSRLITN